MTTKEAEKQYEELLSIRSMAQVIIEKIDKIIKVDAPREHLSEMQIHFLKRKSQFYKRLEKRRDEREAAGKTNL
jgi:hypothetical protein